RLLPGRPRRRSDRRPQGDPGQAVAARPQAFPGPLPRLSRADATRRRPGPIRPVRRRGGPEGGDRMTTIDRPHGLELVDLEALARWMADQGLGAGPITEVVQLTGGSQNVLLRFR